MFNHTKRSVPTLLAVGLSLALSACGGGGVDSKPKLDTGGTDNTDNTGDVNNDVAVTISALQGDITVDKYENGTFNLKTLPSGQVLKYCTGLGDPIETCGLVSYIVSGGIGELQKVKKENPVTVNYELVSESGNIDDILKDPNKKSGTITFDSENVQETLTFELKSDEKQNEDWHVTLVLSNPKGGADISNIITDNLKMTIKDAKADSGISSNSPHNDTGVMYTGLPVGNEKSCTSTKESNQDCTIGRDTTDNDNADGSAGFSFTKIDASGKELDNSATEWSCVKDNVTGLIWERKTYAEESDNRDYQDFRHSYAYYNANTGIGKEQKDEDCKLDNCTTASYLNKINEDKFCGISDWRLPTRLELFDLADLNTRDGYKVLHADLLYDIAMDYESKPNKKMPVSIWTNSIAASYDQHDGYSGPYSLKFNNIWIMYPNGGLDKEDPNGNYSTASILAVSGQ